MKMKKTVWFVLWGGLWAYAGATLLKKGLYLLTLADGLSTLSTLIKGIFKWSFSDEKVSMALIALAILVGVIKGKTVIAKAAKRIIDKISVIDGPVALRQALDIKTLLIMGVMITLGVVLNTFDVKREVRGFIDTIVGAGLLQGSFVFFKELFAGKKKALLSK